MAARSAASGKEIEKNLAGKSELSPPEFDESCEEAIEAAAPSCGDPAETTRGHQTTREFPALSSRYQHPSVGLRFLEAIALRFSILEGCPERRAGFPALHPHDPFFAHRLIIRHHALRIQRWALR